MTYHPGYFPAWKKGRKQGEGLPVTFGNQAGVGVGFPPPLSPPRITTTSRPDADAGHRGPIPSRPHLVSQCYLLSYKLTTFGEVVQLLFSFLFLAFLISASFTLLCPPAVCLLTPGFHKQNFSIWSQWCHVFPTFGLFHRASPRKADPRAGADVFPRERRPRCF